MNATHPTVQQEVTELVSVEELLELDAGSSSGTHNTGGTFGTATCPFSVGTAFSFT